MPSPSKGPEPETRRSVVELIRPFISWEFVRFVIAGGGAAAINWLARLALSPILAFTPSVIVAYGIGMLSAFVLNSLFVFPYSDRPRRLQFRDFVIVNMISFPIVWIVSVVLRSWLIRWGWPYWPDATAHAVAVASPTLVVFLIYKFIVFRISPDAKDDSA